MRVQFNASGLSTHLRISSALVLDNSSSSSSHNFYSVLNAFYFGMRWNEMNDKNSTDFYGNNNGYFSKFAIVSLFLNLLLLNIKNRIFWKLHNHHVNYGFYSRFNSHLWLFLIHCFHKNITYLNSNQQIKCIKECLNSE